MPKLVNTLTNDGEDGRVARGAGAGDTGVGSSRVGTAPANREHAGRHARRFGRRQLHRGPDDKRADGPPLVVGGDNDMLRPDYSDARMIALLPRVFDACADQPTRLAGRGIGKTEGSGAVAGDSSRIRKWWFKNGRTYTGVAAMVVWVGGTMVGFVTLAGSEADNPGWNALLVVVWLVGIFGIGGLFGGFRRPAPSWRPLVAVLSEWAKDHGGAEDPIAAQPAFHRRVVCAAASDERRNVWSAHAATDGYPIRLLLHGVSGEYGSSEGQLRGRKGEDRLPTIHYTVMVADTGVELPGVVVAVPQTDPDDFLMPDYTKRIEFESLEFNERWEVRSVDVSIGHRVFDPRTIEILLELEATDIRIVWDGTSVVVAREGADVDAAELDRWLALIDRMVRNGRLIGRSA